MGVPSMLETLSRISRSPAGRVPAYRARPRCSCAASASCVIPAGRRATTSSRSAAASALGSIAIQIGAFISENQNRSGSTPATV